MRPLNLSPAAGPDADETALTGEEAFAGALALMTEHARSAGEEQSALARTVSMYLMEIATAACPSAQCRLALLVLAAHWASMAEARSFSQQEIVSWHVAPGTIQ